MAGSAEGGCLSNKRDLRLPGTTRIVMTFRASRDTRPSVCLLALDPTYLTRSSQHGVSQIDLRRGPTHTKPLRNASKLQFFFLRGPAVQRSEHDFCSTKTWVLSNNLE